ncbi:MAG: hypothetical protein SFU25_07450 [Candidatus Caenarcaniphilales bacterium]|nr:hypothetical protein [Candidatus Caenarcaniphilales bacterium]
MTAVAAILNRGSPNSTFQQAVQNHIQTSLPNKLPFKQGIQSALSSLPPFLVEMLIVGSFINGLGQSLQEALMQLIPRAGAGMVIRKTPLIAVDESILELSEYLLAFIMPTVIAVGLSKPLMSLLNVPHYELFGQTVHELEAKQNTTFEIGTLNKAQVKLTPEILGRISVGKLAMFGFLAIYAFCMEFISAGLKVIAMDKIFGTTNFYTISGLNQKTEENSNEGDHALKQAWINIKRVMIALPLVLPLCFGLAYLGGKNKGFAQSKFVNQASKILDMSKNFGLPKTLLATSVLTAGLFAYPSVARNKAERLEVTHRVVYFVAPVTILFKQIIGNILAWITGMAYGLGNILAPIDNYFSEVKSGERNIFDLGLVGIHAGKDGNYSGRLEKLSSVRELKEKDLNKYTKVMKSISFMEHWAPYWMALVVGIGINWLNYLRTSLLHQQESGQNNSSSGESNPASNKELNSNLSDYVSARALGNKI